MDNDDIVLELESLKKELVDAQEEIAAHREQLDDAKEALEPCVLVQGGPLDGSILRSKYLPTDDIVYMHSRGWYDSSGFWHEETRNGI